MLSNPSFICILRLCPVKEFLNSQKFFTFKLVKGSRESDNATKRFYVINSATCMNDVSRIGNRRDEVLFRQTKSVVFRHPYAVLTCDLTPTDFEKVAEVDELFVSYDFLVPEQDRPTTLCFSSDLVGEMAPSKVQKLLKSVNLFEFNISICRPWLETRDTC